MTAPSRCMSHARFVLAGLATVGLVVAACNSATPPASVTSSRGAEPTTTQPPTTAGALSSGPGSASPPAVSQSQTIHLIEHPTNVNFVSVGSLKLDSLTDCTKATSCQGAYLIGDNPVFDAVTNKQVGTITFECFFFDAGNLLVHCPGITITLTDRGQIAFNEIVDLGGEVRPANGTIIGGTGEFLGTTGIVTSRKLASTSDFVITITK